MNFGYNIWTQNKQIPGLLYINTGPIQHLSIAQYLKTVTACLSGISAVVDILKPSDTPF